MTKPLIILGVAMILSSADGEVANGHLRKFPYNIKQYLAAISQVESRDDDHAHGKHGELSAYQITKAVWHQNCSYPFSPPYTTSRRIAGEVAAKHLVWIHTVYTDRFGQMPPDIGTYYMIYNMGWSKYLRMRGAQLNKSLPSKMEKRKMAFVNALNSVS